MISDRRRHFHVLTLVLAMAVVELGKSPAHAIFEMGFGLFGPQVPSPTQFINDHALVRAGAAQRLPSRNVYANNANSFHNRLRDNGLSSHYSVDSRRSPGFEVDRRRERSLSQARTTTPAPAPAPVAEPQPDARPVSAINTFFNTARQLVWPSASPVTDDLKPKRNISDQACLVVLEIVEKHGSAPVTTVTDARQRLLDYGQPALRLIRTVATPRIAEGFHVFLLALYDSLGAAANPADGN
jgi:hypothetical protein